jgi:hypothetical protein
MGQKRLLVLLNTLLHSPRLHACEGGKRLQGAADTHLEWCLGVGFKRECSAANQSTANRSESLKRLLRACA